MDIAALLLWRWSLYHWGRWWR